MLLFNSHIFSSLFSFLANTKGDAVTGMVALCLDKLNFSVQLRISASHGNDDDHDEDVRGASRILQRTKRMIRAANPHCVDRHQGDMCPWTLDYISFAEVRKLATDCAHKFKLCLVYEENES